MQQHPHISEIDTILRQHFAHRSDVLVAGEGYLCYTTHNRANWLVPDCVVAFGVDPAAILRRNGYVISEVGKQPEFVLEVASKTTAETDYTKKRDGYASYGIAEFWRFDATGGERYGAALAGDSLANGVYQPLELHHEPGGLIWGHSAILGLDLCWENGRLRFYDPAAGQYLRNLAEAEAARADAVTRGNSAEARAAEAEARRDAAKARAAEAEAELRRLREQLGRQQAE
jgi:hypothetical protein